METFYNGLEPQTRVMLDASAGGVLLNLSYNEACELIDRIATNSSSWPTERVSTQKKTSGVHEINEISALSAQVASLANLVKSLNKTSATAPCADAPNEKTAAAIEQAPPGTVSCVFCGGGHLYEECSSNPVSVNFVGYNRNNNPYSNTYNAGWRNHPNFKWSNNNAGATAPSAIAPNNPPGFHSQNYQRPQQQPATDNSIEGLLKAFINENRTARQAQDASIKNLENQVGQLATALHQRPAGTLPSNTEETSSQRPGKEHCKAISLRNGKDLAEPYENEGPGMSKEEKEKNEKNSQGAEASDAAAPQHVPTPRLVTEYPPPPFPQRLKKAHEEKQFSKFLDILKQLHINVPLIEALQQMPNYAKFMKDVISKRKRLGDFETVALSKECSLILQNKIPRKLKDPGSFTIPFSIGNYYTGRALCDLGASINLMPKSVFTQLGIGNAKPTTVTLSLADRSIAYPEGIIEDILVKVDKFVFPADFVILDFAADEEVPVILGRPFLATGKTLIDVQKGELTMRVNDQEVKINVMNALKYPTEDIEECSVIMSLDQLMQKQFHKQHDHLMNALASNAPALKDEEIEEKHPPQNELKFFQEHENCYPKCLLVGACDHLFPYAKYMGVLTKRRKRKDDIFFLSYYPP